MTRRNTLPSSFQLRYTSRNVGSFNGYAPNAIHRLDDGTCWRQQTARTEPAYSERPACWVYFDGNVHYLDVEGTSGVVEIRACVDPDLPMAPGPRMPG